MQSQEIILLTSCNEFIPFLSESVFIVVDLNFFRGSLDLFFKKNFLGYFSLQVLKVWWRTLLEWFNKLDKNNVEASLENQVLMKEEYAALHAKLSAAIVDVLHEDQATIDQAVIAARFIYFFILCFFTFFTN